MRASSLVALVLLACGTSAPAAPSEPPPPVRLEAARAPAPHVDGELEDPGWDRAQVSARFVDAVTGEAITPYTEARALCDDEALTIALYAADEDVVGSDRMGAILHAPGGATHVVEVDPRGTVRWHAPSEASGEAPEGVTAAIDADATIDHDDLEDEEWIVELRVPWRALGMSGPGDVRANFFRRDQPRSSLVRSLAWSPWRDQPTATLATLGLVTCAAH